MRNFERGDFLILLGIASLVIGIGMIYPPAALISFGIIVCAIGYLHK